LAGASLTGFLTAGAYGVGLRGIFFFSVVDGAGGAAVLGAVDGIVLAAPADVAGFCKPFCAGAGVGAGAEDATGRGLARPTVAAVRGALEVARTVVVDATRTGAGGTTVASETREAAVVPTAAGLGGVAVAAGSVAAVAAAGAGTCAVSSSKTRATAQRLGSAVAGAGLKKLSS
jgi:hypothetical protein